MKPVIDKAELRVIREPPKAVADHLMGMRGKLQAVWDEDFQQWAIYRTDRGQLEHQCNWPHRELTASVISWLQKKDTTEQGRLSDEDRQERFKRWFYKDREQEDHNKLVRRNDNLHISSEMKERARFLADRMHGGIRRNLGCAAAKRLLIPDKVVGVNPETGKPVRAYRRK